MTKSRSFAVLALFLFPLAACGSDPGEDAATSASEELRGNPRNIDIGFDGAAGGFGVDQFQYFSHFFGASSIHPGPRLCHTYVQWDVAGQPAAMGDASSAGGKRPAFEYWLSHAQTDGQCGEVLISFQGHAIDDNGNAIPGERCANGSTPPCDAPSEAQVRDAFVRFIQTDWRSETGYAGAFAFTPWNEPNNEGAAGNGLGKVIPPARAAQYYLTMASLCESHGCKVAAGDFASNGSWPKDFEWNCANDNVANMTTDRNGTNWCRNASSENPGNHLPASYLDIYKDYIANNAHNYPGFGNGYRPRYFAYHGWHDANEYVNNGAHCVDYATCVTRRILTSLGGSWGGVQIWDTEVGSSQGDTISDETQACGAAFLLRLSTLSSRINRIYYTRIHGGGGELVSGSSPATARARPALDVLAKRETSFSGACR